MRHPVIILVALLLPPSAVAGVYKCEANGKTVYQQTPCVNQSGTDTGIKTHGYSNSSAASSSGLRPSEIDILNRIKAKELVQQGQQPTDQLARPQIPQPIHLDYDERIEISNLEKSLNDSNLVRIEANFLYAEIQRVRRGALRQLSYEEKIDRSNQLRALRSRDVSRKRKAIYVIESIYGRYMDIPDSAATPAYTDADWIQRKWHGPEGVVYQHRKGHLVISWNGDSYFPARISSDAKWVQAKWHGFDGVIYLNTQGHLIFSWDGSAYFPWK